MERAEVNDDLLITEVLPRLRAVMGIMDAAVAELVSIDDARMAVDTLLQKVTDIIEEDAAP
jgi:uncharacterized protein YlxW (UPF0749 family)